MTSRPMMNTTLAACAILSWLAATAQADELRNLKRGEPLTAFKLVTIDGELIDSETYKGSVLVMVYLSAEQRSSELAAMDAHTVVDRFKASAREPQDDRSPTPPDEDNDVAVKLLYITADVVRKAHFQRFRAERELDAPLALDADRSLYGKLGLIVFPTTIIVNREGRLAHVISLHNPDYSHVLDSNIRHTLEMIDDEQLRERLQARPSSEGSPKSRASAHRALARLMREQGRLDAAREELVKSREQDPDNAEILVDLADLDVALNNLEEAQQLIEHVLRDNAGHRRAKQISGIILYRQGHLAEAEGVLQKALYLNPDPARIHYYLGRVYERQGQTDKSLLHYRQALKRLLNESEPEAPAAQ